MIEGRIETLRAAHDILPVTVPQAVIFPGTGVTLQDWIDQYAGVPQRRLNIACLGDSATVQQWYETLHTYLPVGSLIARGTNGVSWTHYAAGDDLNAIRTAYNNGTVVDSAGVTVEYPDYFVVFYSLNPPNTEGDPQGVMEKAVGSLNPSLSQAEAIRYYVNRIRSWWPRTRIILMSRYQAWQFSTLPDKGKSVSDNVIEMAHRMSVLAINLFATLGVDPVFEPGRLLQDGIHLNEAGRDRLSKTVAGFIRSVEL